MEEVLERDNLRKALRRVKSNKGSSGIDGMSVWQLPGYLKEHWQEERDQLLRGTYKPQPVKRVEIAKPGGGVRKLGIPTVLDRFIQQALLQVLQKYWDSTFSEHSFGFGQTIDVLKKLDSWIRRRLRCVAWKQWKRGRVRFAELRARGVIKDLAAQTAGSPHGPWRISRSPALSFAFPNAYFKTLGLPSLAST